MVEKVADYGNRKTILIGQESFYIALPCVLSGSANATIKAGEPLTGDITDRDTGFTASTSSAVGVNLHDVKLNASGKGNGTIVLAGCIDELKLEEAVASNLETAKSSLNNIIVVKGSAI